MRYVTLDSAKARAPLDALCHHLGIELGWDDRAVCPFHDDHDPSLYLWYGNEGEQRWWCQVCGFGGDQVDLLMRLRGLRMPEAIMELDRIADDLPKAAPRRRPPRDPVSDMRRLRETVADARERAALPEFDGYMSAYGVGLLTEETVSDRYWWDAYLRLIGWGVDDLGRVVMPHWDPDGELTGAKVRRPDGSRVSVPGSTYRYLYPAWHPRTDDAVMLVEGETDYAWAAAQGAGADVRSIPRGAPGLSDPLTDDDLRLLDELTQWRMVILAFDGDDAGDEATRRWREGARTVGCHDVRVLDVPRGHDLRSAGVPVRHLELLS